jgi:SAM-dependent methyltransferase
MLPETALLNQTMSMLMQEEVFEYPDQYYNSQSAEQVLPVILALYNPDSMLDIGCGNGTWLLAASKLGIQDLFGVDAQESDAGNWPLSKDQFSIKDLTQPFSLGRKFDMAICLEVAEHLPPTAASTLIDSLVKHSDLIVFSAAIPGQEGDRHIHNNEPAYWQQLFRERGFNTQDNIRPQIWDNEKVFWWYRQNIFIAQKSRDECKKPFDKIPHLVHPEHFKEKIESVERYKKAVTYYENNLKESQQRDKSFWYHVKCLIKLIINRK